MVWKVRGHLTEEVDDADDKEGALLVDAHEKAVVHDTLLRQERRVCCQRSFQQREGFRTHLPSHVITPM